MEIRINSRFFCLRVSLYDTLPPRFRHPKPLECQIVAVKIPSAEGCRDPAEGILADKRKRRRNAGVACVIKKWYWSPFKVMGPMPVFTIPFSLCHSLEVFGISFF